MPKVKQQTAGTIGLVAAILYIIGNVVGIGIFFKNSTVFRLNEYNCIGILAAWILSTIIVLCMALSFAEISSCKMKNKNAGVGGWATQFCGHKFGRYAKTGYSLIFWPLNTFAVLFFAGEATLKCFAPLLGSEYWYNNYDYGHMTTFYVFIIGAVLFVLFMSLNYYKSKAMGKTGSIISFVKFAPILMVVALGIAFGIMWSNNGLWNSTQDSVQAVANSGNDFKVIGVFSAIPAILFSFEGYISIGNISSEIKNPEKNLSLAVILGVVVIAVLYLAVTIGCITAGTGNVYDLFQMVEDHSEIGFKILTTLISIFIFICLIGCVNGMCKGGVCAFQSLAQENDLFKSKALLNVRPGDNMFAGMILFVIVVGFWWVFLIIPSTILNTDALADGSSTSMVVMLYVIYGVTVAGGFANRFSKKVEVRKMKLFPLTATIGVLGCIFLVSYVSIYQFTLAPVAGGLSNENITEFCKAPSGWGMFVKAGVQFTNLETLIWFWAMTAVAALTPVANDVLIKLFDRSNKTPLLWDNVKKTVVLK